MKTVGVKELKARLSESLDRLAAAGEVSRATSRKGGWRWKPAGLGLRPAVAARVLSDLRGERMRRAAD